MFAISCLLQLINKPVKLPDTNRKRMIRNLLAFSFLFLIPFFSSAQNFSGQWKGQFTDQSTKTLGWGGDQCEYVLDIEISGKNVTGYSYTYFSAGEKKYYTICRLVGFVNPRSKYVEVREVERTKTNVPSDIRNCFQVHKLTYFKPAANDGDETLAGSWVPAPNQSGNCGFGVTSLSRRLLAKTYPGFRGSTARRTDPRSYTPPVKKDPEPGEVASIAKAPVTTAPRTPAPIIKDTEKTSIAKTPEQVTEPRVKEPIKQPEETISLPRLETAGLKFEKRNNTVLKTIIVESGSVRIDLYDNGEVDGDSISLFLNSKLLMTHKKLTTQAITIRIPVEELEDENELVMYADNLGSIPPNTALMVVTDGTKRYEVRITSDLEKSGTIRFVKRK